MPGTDPRSTRLSRWLAFVLILGLYLTLRGYHSRDGDQAYRLPLLLHRQNPALFADDPFVRAFDAFNPHRGYLALLDGASRLLGLSAGLAAPLRPAGALTPLGADVRPDLPGDRSPGARGLARVGTEGRRGGGGPGPAGEGRQCRDEPPVR